MAGLTSRASVYAMLFTLVIAAGLAGCTTTRERAESGDSQAQFAMAKKCLQSADPATTAAGVQWLKQASNNGHPAAQASMARRYMEGQGVDKDPERAVALAKKAAGQGHVGALELLAVWYRRGQGVEKNKELADSYERQAERMWEYHMMKQRQQARAEAQARREYWETYRQQQQAQSDDREEDIRDGVRQGLREYDQGIIRLK